MENPFRKNGNSNGERPMGYDYQVVIYGRPEKVGGLLRLLPSSLVTTITAVRVTAADGYMQKEQAQRELPRIVQNTAATFERPGERFFGRVEKVNGSRP